MGEKRRNRKAPTEAEKNERKSNLKIDSPRKKEKRLASPASSVRMGIWEVYFSVYYVPELTLEIENVYA